jgi:hypothetical protein
VLHLLLAFEGPKRRAHAPDTDAFDRSMLLDRQEVDRMAAKEPKRPQSGEVHEMIQVVKGAAAVECIPQMGLWMVSKDMVVQMSQRGNRDIELSCELNLRQSRILTNLDRILAIEITVDVQNTVGEQHPRAAVIGELVSEMRVPS